MMWLPEPIYKLLPTIYAVMGVFFILGVLYVGLDAPNSPIYLVLGLVSILASITVTIWRAKKSGNSDNAESDDAQTS